MKRKYLKNNKNEMILKWIYFEWKQKFVFQKKLKLILRKYIWKERHCKLN